MKWIRDRIGFSRLEVSPREARQATIDKPTLYVLILGTVGAIACVAIAAFVFA